MRRHQVLMILALAALFSRALAVTGAAVEPVHERIILSSNHKGFIGEKSKRAFHPWGVNYGNDGRLLEDFWDRDWAVLAVDFAKIRKMGANVARVHLQFGKFMEAPDSPNAAALVQLSRLVALAEVNGLYLDITGLACYRPSDTPRWYDALDDKSRWEAQACFWRAVADLCTKSPAVFCYDLMNEPISPSAKTDKWYSGALLGDYDFIQIIAHDPAERTRGETANAWIDRMTTAIRAKDKSHMITVGMLPWVTGWQHLSGFIPGEVAPHLDFLSVHIYPNTKQPAEALRSLRECDVGKPVVIEETFPLSCSVDELEKFLRASRATACGWIWHYDGTTADELDARFQTNQPTAAQAIWRSALRSFERLRPEFVDATGR
jgi:hypothetical protein